MGKSIEVLEPKAFETQGYMEPRYKWIMRLWVILAEYLIFIPAAYYLLHAMNGRVTPYSLAIITCIPASMIVDNAHFQFNQVMHGFVLAAIASILND